MLEIQTKKENHWARNFLLFIVLLLLAAGGYILITVFAPLTNEEFLTGREPYVTAKKLEKPPVDDRLFIPQINVDVAITEGDSRALQKGAWHRKPENGNPAEGGNFVLSAHRFVMDYTPQGTAKKSPFYNIDRLTVGDRIYVDYQGKRYKYDITKKYAVPSDAADIEVRSDEPKLTLYSCTLTGSADGRDVIEATPVIQEEE